MEKRYIVVDMPISGTGDSWTDIYGTAEEANREASGAWDQLSEADRRNRQIFSAVVSIEDLADYSEEDGKIDLACWGNCNTFPGAFDSRKLQNSQQKRAGKCLLFFDPHGKCRSQNCGESFNNKEVVKRRECVFDHTISIAWISDLFVSDLSHVLQLRHAVSAYSISPERFIFSAVQLRPADVQLVT